jgi:HAD superfamily hydrolase (TIGR01549 family)
MGGQGVTWGEKAIRGVIFDLDGTLFDADYEWPAIRRELGVSDADGTILDFLQSLPAEQAREKKALLESIEDRATRTGRLKPAALELLADLRGMEMKLALVTNNRETNARQVLDRFKLAFDAVLTRDDGWYKPSGEPLLQAARRMGLPPDQLAAVGDNDLDLQAARSAGVALAVIVNPDGGQFVGRCDVLVPDLDQLRTVFARLGGSGGAGESTEIVERF